MRADGKVINSGDKRGGVLNMQRRNPRIIRFTRGFVLALLLLGMMISATYAATSSISFKDTVGHWASSSIQRLAGLGILTGYNDGNFKPDERVTRAEVAAIIDRTLNVVGQNQQETATTEVIARGAKLYDSWIKEAGAATPAADQPLWALQTSNTRSGKDTWRCKECHGWDYKGKGGAYSSGSHATGFPGVYAASANLDKAELVAVLQGSTDYRHDFSTVLGDDDLQALAAFLKEGLINETTYINYSTKTSINADVNSGQQKFNTACAGCHAADGTQINFGSQEAPEYVGTIAKSNPWEFIHKVRLGQPGSSMPSAAQLGWSLQDVLDVLGYTQSLPVK